MPFAFRKQMWFEMHSFRHENLKPYRSSPFLLYVICPHVECRYFRLCTFRHLTIITMRNMVTFDGRLQAKTYFSKSIPYSVCVCREMNVLALRFVRLGVSRLENEIFTFGSSSLPRRSLATFTEVYCKDTVFSVSTMEKPKKCYFFNDF